MTRLRTLSTRVAWMPWGPAAFARARAETKPILLSIVAEWCASSREMDRTSYADPFVATSINEQFVPVRVDADRQPDVAERYGLGGWPTTAFLNAAGAILGGGTFVEVARMPAVLAQVQAAVRGADPMVRGGGSPGAPPAELPPAALEQMVLDAWDPPHGGFGTAPKFPLDGPVRLALDGRAAAAAASLDAMGWGPLFDDVHGGFFHYARGRDWSDPQTEKLLETNARLLRLYLDASLRLGTPRFAARAADILRYVQAWLADPVDGGWFNAQYAADAYYAAADRDLAAAPPVGTTMFADANGLMVSAALHAAAVFDDDGLRAFAVKSLERVLLGCYKPGDGVAHYFDEGRRSAGLLGDQVAMARACLDVHGLTGNVVYLMMAEELMHFAVRTMWNERDGGFFDRAAQKDDEGLLHERLVPFVLNCEAAAVLHDVAAASGDPEFSGRAARALAAMASRAPAQGPLAAHYLLALRAVSLR